MGTGWRDVKRCGEEDIFWTGLTEFLVKINGIQRGEVSHGAPAEGGTQRAEED